MGLPTISETTSYGEMVFAGVPQTSVGPREGLRSAEERLAAKVAEKEAWWVSLTEAERMNWKLDRFNEKLDLYESHKGKSPPPGNLIPPGYGGV